MNVQQIKNQITLSGYLKEQGYSPARKVGVQLAYQSPFRDEKVPSFFVNDQKGVWYDHGEGKGGTVIDLAMQLHNLSFPEVIEHFNQGNFPRIAIRNFQFEKTKKEESPIDIVKVQNLGENQALIDYLKIRGIYEEAVKTGFLKEIYYRVTVNNEEKHYFGVGWQNEAGGWEVSSKYSKMCLLQKDISKASKNDLNLNAEKVAVFEAMFDYLSALKLNWIKDHDHAIVLNSTALVAGLRMKLSRYNSLQKIECYFDNDKSGDMATKTLAVFASKNDMQFSDMRGNYQDAKDINEHLNLLNCKRGVAR